MVGGCGCGCGGRGGGAPAHQYLRMPQLVAQGGEPSHVAGTLCSLPKALLHPH